MRRSKTRKAALFTASATATSSTAVSAATISDVPDPIVCDILSRLPLSSIFACKRVSKKWLNLIHDPNFETLHLSNSPLSLIFFRNGNINRTNSSHFEILHLPDTPLFSRRSATIKLKIEVYLPNVRIAGSCNGLILLSSNSSFSGRGSDLVVVCNPLRAQHFTLPKLPNTAAWFNTPNFGYGFGHSPVSDKYKVVRFNNLTHSQFMSDFDVCTVGIDYEWRRVGYGGRAPAVFTSQLAFLNGALHWVGYEGKHSWFICYFDVEREEFGSFPLPCHIGLVFPYPGVVDNQLYIQEDCSLNVQKLWVMKDYGDFGSWNLECVIEGPRLGTAKPLKVLRDGTLLLMFSKSSKRTSIEIT